MLTHVSKTILDLNLFFVQLCRGATQTFLKQSKEVNVYSTTSAMNVDKKHKDTYILNTYITHIRPLNTTLNSGKL